ncbi:hypothetical protein Lal_00045446 [Lupinus albus]|uniref:Putative pectinesterase inhibitor domain-containing protein n=1 Tax=Lupinus albus TaxID=3870 RepID=A0A6A4P224_LUPAL|nr:putative pectinesterase inhibitor domain-containing protein [Lupinus albus]KAF1886216.1 hypothetical protein Lal_00045446 [Lupinus albus]
MAYFSIRPSLISYLVLVFLLFAATSSASKVVDVNVICNQAQDPSLCSSILNSKPGGTKGADLISLAQYTIDVARVKANDTINLINMLIANSDSDSKGKNHYKACLTNFNKDEGALKDIDYVQELLKNEDYFGISAAARAINIDIDDCITGYDTKDTPYDDKSKLPQHADIVEKVVDIILIISTYLIQN